MCQKDSSFGGRFTGRCFTLIELLVVVAIIAVLAAILLPVLQKAKVVAIRASCSNDMRQIMLGMMMYADDFDDFTPVEPPYNGADWTLKTGETVVGSQIWGLTRTPAKNGALGLGACVQQGYTNVELMWCPADRDVNLAASYANQYGWYGMRKAFGDAYQAPWSSAAYPGLQWTPWLSGSNFYLESSYLYRSYDFALPKSIGGATNALRKNVGNAKVTSTGYTERAILMDRNYWTHKEYGYNVAYGDMSVNWWRAPEAKTYVTIGVGPNYPSTEGRNDFFRCYLMDVADEAARN